MALQASHDGIHVAGIHIASFEDAGRFQGQGTRMPLNWKRQESDAPLGLPEGTRPTHTFIISPKGPRLDI